MLMYMFNSWACEDTIYLCVYKNADFKSLILLADILVDNSSLH